MERKRSFKRRQKPPLAERAKEQCREFTAFMFSNVGIIMLVVIYMIGGAFMFQKIEGQEAESRFNKTNNDMTDLRTAVTKQLWNLSCCEAIGNNETFYFSEANKIALNYQKRIVEAGKSGWLASGSISNTTGSTTSKDPIKWTISVAILYCITVITTIGYGNVTPQTPLGKIITILYAIIGMPLFLLYLSNIGDIFAKSFKWVYAKVCLCRICPGVAKRRAIRAKRKRRALQMALAGEVVDKDFYFGSDISSLTSTSSPSTDSVERAEQIMNGIETGTSSSTEEEEDTNQVNVPITICLMMMIAYIGLGAFIFRDWNPVALNGCYFSFISLSSIGFGDIVPLYPTNAPTNMVDYKFIVCAIYLLIGMALIAMCFNLMQEQVIHNIRAIKRAIRICFRCEQCNCISRKLP